MRALGVCRRHAPEHRVSPLRGELASVFCCPCCSHSNRGMSDPLPTAVLPQTGRHSDARLPSSLKPMVRSTSTEHSLLERCTCVLRRPVLISSTRRV